MTGEGYSYMYMYTRTSPWQPHLRGDQFPQSEWKLCNYVQWLATRTLPTSLPPSLCLLVKDKQDMDPLSHPPLDVNPHIRDHNWGSLAATAILTQEEGNWMHSKHPYLTGGKSRSGKPSPHRFLPTTA